MVEPLLAALCDVCAPAYPMVLSTCARLLGDDPRIVSIEPGVRNSRAIYYFVSCPSISLETSLVPRYDDLSILQLQLQLQLPYCNIMDVAGASSSLFPNAYYDVTTYLEGK